MKLYIDPESFIEWLKKRPIQAAPSNNPYELFRYYNTWTDEAEGGAPEWGIIYKNNRGRITLVGAAVADYEDFKNV